MRLAHEYREKMIEAISECDDELTEKYLEGETLTNEEIARGIRLGTLNRKIFPVICGTAFKNKGVQKMLDAVTDYLPSPLEVPPVKGYDVDDRSIEMHRLSDDNEPFSGLVFKIMTDPFVGQLAFVRVYSGGVRTGESVYNAVKGKKERIGRIVKMHANKREEVDEVLAGDIAACVGLKQVGTGDTICAEKAPILLEAIDFPEPVIQLAIEPKTKSDQEKLGVAIGKLTNEDPTLRVNTDQETGQTILAGMGELHLEIIVDRLRREFNVEANVGKPQVAYRETIRNKADGEGRFVRQSGGRGQYGHVKIRVEPLERGSGFEFVNGIVGGSVPKEYIGPAEAGMKEALEGGILAGYPMSDLRVTVYDGSYHEVDSSEMAFKIAGSMAIKEVAGKAKPVLLEPVMRIEVVVPDDYMGAVNGDLISRRGRLEGTEIHGATHIIKAMVPLSAMFGYATDLRSRTQGRGSFTMHFGQYEEAPKSVADEIIGKVRGKVAS
ncbi:MAG: elongation factor G [Bryobacterales bacterium]|nr:elongation factor G [Bryobacterales bacterium]